MLPTVYHLSYGMVDLSIGKIKSREGTVVDAGQLIGEMVNMAARYTRQLDKITYLRLLTLLSSPNLWMLNFL